MKTNLFISIFITAAILLITSFVLAQSEEIPYQTKAFLDTQNKIYRSMILWPTNMGAELRNRQRTKNFQDYWEQREGK